MPEIVMRVREVFAALETVQRLLVIHTPLPASQDGGASARAGIKLRRIRRALAEIQDDAREQAQRGADAGATFASQVTLSIPELLTRADWDAIPMSVPHMMPSLGADGQPVTVTLRRTEADLDALGPLVSDPDEV